MKSGSVLGSQISRRIDNVFDGWENGLGSGSVVSSDGESPLHSFDPSSQSGTGTFSRIFLWSDNHDDGSGTYFGFVVVSRSDSGLGRGSGSRSHIFSEDD